MKNANLEKVRKCLPFRATWITAFFNHCFSNVTDSFTDENRKQNINSRCGDFLGNHKQEKLKNIAVHNPSSRKTKLICKTSTNLKAFTPENGFPSPYSGDNLKCKFSTLFFWTFRSRKFGAIPSNILKKCVKIPLAFLKVRVAVPKTVYLI